MQGKKRYFAEKARQTYLDEGICEVHEIASLAAKAVQIAPTQEKREKFQRLAKATKDYTQALDDAVKTASSDSAGTTVGLYEETARTLRETAEDGEMAGATPAGPHKARL